MLEAVADEGLLGHSGGSRRELHAQTRRHPGLLGRTGEKSTTVSTITGLLERSGGHVFFEGLDMRDAPLEYKAYRIPRW
jgi:ABC-type branched-subunit amino acid transport system ATPase component